MACSYHNGSIQSERDYIERAMIQNNKSSLPAQCMLFLRNYFIIQNIYSLLCSEFSLDARNAGKFIKITISTLIIKHSRNMYTSISNANPQ